MKGGAVSGTKCSAQRCRTRDSETVPRVHRPDPYRTNRPEWDYAELLPRRRMPRPEDIDLEPPDIGDVLAEKWQRFKPWLLRFIGRPIREPLVGEPSPAVGNIRWHQEEVFREPPRVTNG